MPSLFPNFKAQLNEVASPRDVRVGPTYLKRQRNAIGLRGNITGKLYVSQNRYARNWSVTQAAVTQLMHGDSPWAIVLLHKRPNRGLLLTPKLVREGIEKWKLDSYQGQYRVQARHSRDALPFQSLDELLGMLRIVLGSQ